MSAAAAERAVVGQPITSPEDLLGLPIGTLIGPNKQARWKKIDRVTWESVPDGSPAHYSGFSGGGYNKVLWLPEGSVALMSLAQWKWRWLDNAYYSAEQAGVGYNTIAAGAEAAGIDEVEDFPAGAGIVIRSRWGRDRLPAGSVVQVGEPTSTRTYGVLRKRTGDDYELILGRNTAIHGAKVVVLSVPDGTIAAWYTEPGTEEEQADISRWKARAWRVGWKVKIANSWCNTYESYMAQAGFTADVLREAKYEGLGIGDRVPPEQAAALPERSVLRWRHSQDSNQFAWFERVNGVVNRAMTHRLFGSDGVNRHYASSMEVLWIADEERRDWTIPISEEEVACLPPGARVQIGGAPYMIARDRRIAQDTRTSGLIPEVGTWDAVQFHGGGEWNLVGIR